MTMNEPFAGRQRAGDGGHAALLAGLTPEQAQAVRHGDGPLLIVAGPGTGKTRTLTHRIAYLLASGRAAPREILAVTFSTRAAGELRLRLADLLGEQTARGVTAATFHSVCARLLREHASVFGRTDGYTIYDQADLRHVIERVLSDGRRGEIMHALERCGRPSAAELEHQISVAKNRLLGPETFEGALAPAAAPLIAAVWRVCERELARCNAWSFDDLLVFAVRLLRGQPQRLTHLRSRWS